MSNEGTPVGTILYTRESDVSRERAKAELEKPDPSPEKAVAVLTKDKEDVNEQTAS